MINDFEILKKCRLCPRKCLIDRFNGNSGYCKSGAGYEIASISVHHGEEPVISGSKGICNVFFSHCNLQCIYCQNYQISRKECRIKPQERTLEDILSEIIPILKSGVESIGFVSPSHMVPQMKEIIYALHDKGYFPFVVYNTNGYDSLETLQSLDGWVDVYLPDFKYSDPELASKYSGAYNYPEIAGLAIKEMYRQKGNVIHMNENGVAEGGLLVRHLVLPGAVENSKGVLRYIARELSTGISISLMSQYSPVPDTLGLRPLNRKLKVSEYYQVVEEMEQLGFSKGWVQEIDSAGFYFPDFESENPFGQ